MQISRATPQNQQITFSDIDATFNLNPATNDLMLSKDVQAVNRSLRNLLLTNHYERPFHPELGSNIRKMLFEADISLTANFMQKEIYNVIQNFEPRVNLISVDIQTLPDQNAIIVNISYYLTNSTTPTTLQIPFQRDLLS